MRARPVATVTLAVGVLAGGAHPTAITRVDGTPGCVAGSPAPLARALYETAREFYLDLELASPFATPGLLEDLTGEAASCRRVVRDRGRFVDRRAGRRGGD